MGTITYSQPLLLLFLGICAAGLLRLRSGRGRRLILVGLAGLFAVSWPPVDWLIGLPLEARYPVRPFQPTPGLEAIVVLGASVEPPEYERPYPLAGAETLAACEHAAWIYRRLGNVPVLAGEGRPTGVPYESVMRTLLERGGVAANSIWTEREARSTHENAVFGGRVLRQHNVKRIVLVVDAQSMLRAAACFRKEGFEVTPAPVGFRSWGSLSDELLPGWRAVRRNEISLHELAGLAWYRLRGWI